MHSSPFSRTYQEVVLVHYREENDLTRNRLSFGTKNPHKSWDSKPSSTFKDRGSCCMSGSHFSQDLNSSINRMRSHDIARLKPLRLGKWYTQVFLFSREDLIDFTVKINTTGTVLIQKSIFTILWKSLCIPVSSEKRCLTRCLVYTCRSADHHGFYILIGILAPSRYTQIIFFHLEKNLLLYMRADLKCITTLPPVPALGSCIIE